MSSFQNFTESFWVPQAWFRGWHRLVSALLVLGLSFSLWSSSPALASIDDDRLDGNIFVVYAGNGSLVPPRLSLAESFQRQLPVVLVYYLDDSQDCKEYAFIVSRIQEFYGRATSIIPVSVDSLLPQAKYAKDDPGRYYQGVVPQTVILDAKGKQIFNAKGVVKFEVVDDVLRDLFNLLPRSESVTLKQRTFNEFNSELVEQ
ncbi:thylakoid membrane photosystem I accumulation factor [Synechocystis sp. LKSZ1]|uniref:thylakoid membrane photosystem I accumulation factor n=1 Tax=Synechocystis sp. LKSZ1 TaxID=3144951 RepID=UPI00336BDB55